MNDPYDADFLAALEGNAAAVGVLAVSRRVIRLEGARAMVRQLANGDAIAHFTALFSRGCALLELDDDAAAQVFDTSRPNVARWRGGVVVPPAATHVLKLLREQLEAKFGV
jgi:hypothetical protein